MKYQIFTVGVTLLAPLVILREKVGLLSFVNPFARETKIGPFQIDILFFGEILDLHIYRSGHAVWPESSVSLVKGFKRAGV